MLKLELKRAFLSVPFYLALTMTLVFLFLSISNEYQFGEMMGALHLFHYSRSGPTAYFSLLAPIFACLPFAASYATDKNNGLHQHIGVRASPATYAFSKWLSVGLSGAIALSAAHLIFLGWLTYQFGIQPIENVLPGPFGTLAETNPYAYLGIILAVTFTFGFVYAVFGLSITTIFTHPIFAYIIPFAFYILPAFIFGFIGWAYLEPTTTWNITQNSLATPVTIFGQLILILMITSILFVSRCTQGRLRE